MNLKKIWNKVKKKRDEKKEIKSLKEKAYLEEMKKQAKIIGKRQAELDSEHREKIYTFKLENQRKKIKNNFEKSPTLKGINNHSNENKSYNWITGKWE